MSAIGARDDQEIPFAFKSGDATECLCLRACVRPYGHVTVSYSHVTVRVTLVCVGAAVRVTLVCIGAPGPSL